jgi:hypothetical protein
VNVVGVLIETPPVNEPPPDLASEVLFFSNIGMEPIAPEVSDAELLVIISFNIFSKNSA